MNRKQCILLLILNLLRASFSESVNEPKYSNFENGSEVLSGAERERTGMKGILYRTVKRYHCSADNNNSVSHLLVYGTKAWTFPQQDVNLTLSYPTDYNYQAEEYKDYVISGLEVILYIDGSESRGYISSGGILEESISVTFILKNISSVAYQFWLYGVPISQLSSDIILDVLNSVHYLC